MGTTKGLVRNFNWVLGGGTPVIRCIDGILLGRMDAKAAGAIEARRRGNGVVSIPLGAGPVAAANGR